MNERSHHHPRDYNSERQPKSRSRQMRDRYGGRRERGPVEAWSPGGEYLRDVPQHRAGWPDIEDEYERNRGYADAVSGGDYLPDYGYRAEQPSDLYHREYIEPRRYGDTEWNPRGYRSGYRENAGSGDDRSAPYGGQGTQHGYGWRGVPGTHTGFRGRGPRNYVRSDERIREDLSERLMEDDSIDASGISIDVHDGVVTLQGSVDERWVKHRVEDMAEMCSGVKDVVNQLRVGTHDTPGTSM